MSLPSPISSMKLRVSSSATPTAQPFEQDISSTDLGNGLGSKSVRITDSSLLNAINTQPWGTIFTPSIVTTYDEGSFPTGDILITHSLSNFITPLFATSTLLARYDASEASNYTLNGSNVTQWNDLTGNGYHLIPNGTGPTLTTINSVTAFDFNSGKGFIKTSVPLSSEITVFMVMKYSTNIGDWGSFMHHGHRDSDWAIERNSWNNAITTHNVQFQSNNVNGPPELSTSNNVNYILIGRISGSTREFWRYSDTETLGFSTGSGVSIATGNKTIYVGKSEINESCNSTIGEILYYNSSLSDANLNTTLVYLQNKWF